MKPPFLFAALAVCIAVNFQILLPVVPVMVERAGPHGSGGAATAALFIGAVTGELSTPWLMSRLRSMHLLIAGELLTAVPSLAYVIPHGAVFAMLAAASARGLGMGIAMVVSVALLSEMTAPNRRGTSIGYYGLALGAPGIIVPTLGVFLLASGHADVDALIALLSGLTGVYCALRLPERQADLVTASTNLIVAIRRPGLLLVIGGFVLSSCSFGGVITYAPVALQLNGLGSAASFLLVMGAARAGSRWLSGVMSDRWPTRIVLVCGVLASLIGLVVLALHSGGATVLVAAAVYGTGYGATQTAAFLAMSERGIRSDSGSISAFWNSGIDLGSSLGGTLIGLAAARSSYVAAAWVLPVVVAMSLPLFLWQGRPVNAPTTDIDIAFR
ncbi:MAG TPA: MFS transporter [Candidatus Micrarchaeaceae archaeon]|nr:MFS transporter [Candidatus Micrarchaeaceae archaeon]